MSPQSSTPALMTAHVISTIAHPFVILCTLAWSVAVYHRTPNEMIRHIIMLVGIPLACVAAVMIYQTRRGAWRTTDASNRHERQQLLIVGLSVSTAFLCVLAASTWHPFLIKGAAAVVAILTMCAALTRWLNVSLHLAFIAFAATILVYLNFPAGWGLVLLVPVLAWSRLALQRHVPLEVAAGVLVGVWSACATLCL
jgi:hypothetical protein